MLWVIPCNSNNRSIYVLSKRSFPTSPTWIEGVINTRPTQIRRTYVDEYLGTTFINCRVYTKNAQGELFPEVCVLVNWGFYLLVLYERLIYESVSKAIHLKLCEKKNREELK